MNITRPLITAALLTLAACAQAPIPGDEVLPDLAPQTFGSSGTDVAISLAKHSTGVYVTGYTTGDLHAINKGEDDLFIRKYDTQGALLWGRQFGTPAPDYPGITDIGGVASDASNNAYVAGTTRGSLAGSRGKDDAFVRKYTSSGSVAWTRQFGTTDYDRASDVAVYGNSVYVSGTFSGSGASITKYNTSGTKQWTQFIYDAALHYSEANDVAVDSGGYVYVVGSVGTFDGAVPNHPDMFISKYSASGRAVWTKKLHYSDIDFAKAVAVSGSSVYLVGQSGTVNEGGMIRWDGVRMVKYISSGSRLWTRVVGQSSDSVYDVTANNSGAIVAGETNHDGFTYKLDTRGTFVWGQLQSTPNVDATKAVLMRTSNEVYVAGETTGAFVYTNRGEKDAFLRRLNGSNGDTVWTDQ